jgi:hypothetical protein
MKNPSKETQKDLEELFNKHQLLPVLRKVFSEMGDTCEVCPPKLATEVLVQIYLHRQADIPTMVGILSPKYGTPQEIADYLEQLCIAEFIMYDDTVNKLMVLFDVSKDIKDMLDRYQYPLPMVIKPRQIKDNFTTGYLKDNSLCVLNGSKYFNDKDLCLDHLNKVNRVELVIDMDVVYSDEGKFISPNKKDDESFTDFRKRNKQMRKFYDSTVDIMNLLNDLSNTVYLTHKYDRRGRVYCSGYHVNTQGTDYNKAVLHFAKKELINV